MPAVTLYHNPRCSKSRATLSLLQENGIEPDIRRYLDEPLTEAEIRALLKKLNISAVEMMRTKEAEFKELGLSKESSDDTLISAMVSTPKLIERPIAETETAAAIGRPPENVLELLA
ncbi:arsenate reductase (glutaredoxin) [Oceanospirillum linum]|uniref:Arsenate reductase n=1 Tax=Oceanospirillum linum TaxID=966 RepID=A0A1T1HD05_OCELI|nr:arsenate reductase (glutaredoxin) [Oceanospirillum linum]OOV87744.1 arsenate reductase (glutaredoxin) [Oceanospirillum linum]SEG13673.1 arsenate reductase [Oleiphilus messinensis]SMP10396.1 arsenate reductase [Oceanospirillum linum]